MVPGRAPGPALPPRRPMTPAAAPLSTGPGGSAVFLPVSFSVGRSDRAISPFPSPSPLVLFSVPSTLLPTGHISTSVRHSQFCLRHSVWLVPVSPALWLEGVAFLRAL